jgi:hypothetical protein
LSDRWFHECVVKDHPRLVSELEISVGLAENAPPIADLGLDCN